MKKIIARSSNRKYIIYINRNISAKAGRLIERHFSGTHKILLVTNEKIYAIYKHMIEENFSQPGFEFYTHIIKDGEIYKSLDTSSQIYDVLLKNDFHRNDLIIAFGGGVIGDLVGYVASTYHRGLNLLQYPTTVIGQVDSSIGGKVAVNYEGLKNMVGTFYHPHMIIIDPSLLGSLEGKEVLNGLGEIIKYGIVFDHRILNMLDRMLKDDENTLSITSHRQFDHIIYRCAKIKTDVVAKDEFDNGYRNLLNFGHTVGHALEKVSKLKEISHGQAVSLGMLVALDISIQLGFASPGIRETVSDLYKKVGLPVHIKGLEPEQIVHAIGFDKKFTARKNKFVLVKGFNRPFFYYGLKKDIIISSIKKNIG